MIDFFQMVSSAAFTNPFSDKRVEIDRKIVGASNQASWDDLQEPLLELISEKIELLKQDNKLIELVHRADLDESAATVAVSVLFSVYHKYIDSFDLLIEEQLHIGDDSCRAPFANQCVDELEKSGFRRVDACRFVSMFYQIRRAYYFISKNLIGNSNCMKQLRSQLWDNIFTHNISWYVRCLWNKMEDFSTLLLGETGTGKGAAAAAIGRSGYIPFNPKTQKFEESFTRAFTAINLSQYPESLIESELFGHRKGAFTGAVDNYDGLFARCSPYGAIFLDEIGDVSIPVQIKLLQVLQERTFSPVGSHEKIRFAGRVIAATNKPIDQLRKDGTFRNDFYYRLCSDLIVVPPLRQRIRETPKELEQLVFHLVKRICGTGIKLPVMQVLKKTCGKNYSWTGNVRELEQAIRRIVLTGTYLGDTIPHPSSKKQVQQFGELTARQLVEKYCCDLYDIYENYGEVARKTGLDWRTVKKYIQNQE